MSLEEGLSLNPLEIGRYAGKIDHTVPLFIKLKGQSNGFEYPEETSTLFLKELTLSLLDGRISSAFDLQTFFDEKGKSRSSEIAKWEGFKH